MTPAEELRAAAQKIREVAGNASPGPWVARPVIYGPADEGWGPPADFEVYGPGTRSESERCVVSHMPHEGGGADETDAAHIALCRTRILGFNRIEQAALDLAIEINGGAR